MGPTRKSIEDQLSEALSIERKRFDEIRAIYRVVMADIPTQMPSPDGIAYIKRIAAEERAARERWADALQRFNDFRIRGVTPDDLQ